MWIKYKYIFPSLYLLIAAIVTFKVQWGILLAAGILGLPWSYLFSIFTGPLYYFFPNTPNSVGLIISLIIPLLINSYLLYLLGKKLDKKNN